MLEDCIKIEEVKGDQGQVELRFVRFDLNVGSLDEVLHKKRKQQPLQLSQSFRVALYSYALVDAQCRLQTGMTFCSSYQNVMVMRTVISMDGDVIHQITRQSLHDSTLCLAISGAHYWLIEQLLNEMRVLGKWWWNWIHWFLSLVINAIALIYYAEQLYNFNPWLLLTPLLSIWLVARLLSPVIRMGLRWFSRLMWKNIFKSLLSGDITGYNKAQGLLGRLIR